MLGSSLLPQPPLLLVHSEPHGDLFPFTAKRINQVRPSLLSASLILVRFLLHPFPKVA